jgi:hypothetical protein
MTSEKKWHVIDDSNGIKHAKKIFESDIREEASDFYNQFEKINKTNVAHLQFNHKWVR